MTTKIEDILESISVIRWISGEHQWLNGGCFLLYIALKGNYPDIEPWYSIIEGHVYIKVGDIFVDIRGVCDNVPEDIFYLPDEPRLFKEAHTWHKNI